MGETTATSCVCGHRASEPVCICGHHAGEHGQEREVFTDTASRRELCMACPGYEEPGYPNGKAWHRFKLHPYERLLAAGEVSRGQ